MKAGDLVYVRELFDFSARPVDEPRLAIIIRDLFPNYRNAGRGFKVMFANGEIKNKLAKHLEAV